MVVYDWMVNGTRALYIEQCLGLLEKLQGYICDRQYRRRAVMFPDCWSKLLDFMKSLSNLIAFYDLYTPDIIYNPVMAFRLYGLTFSSIHNVLVLPLPCHVQCNPTTQLTYEIFNTALTFDHALWKNTLTSHYSTRVHHECKQGPLSRVNSLELVQWAGSYSVLCSI